MLQHGVEDLGGASWRGGGVVAAVAVAIVVEVVVVVVVVVVVLVVVVEVVVFLSYFPKTASRVGSPEL